MNDTRKFGLTVGELITLLQKCNPNDPVVADDHSELGLVGSINVCENAHYDAGGYISHVYYEKDKAKAFRTVYISADRTLQRRITYDS